MIHDALNPGKVETLAILYALFSILFIVATAGKGVIAWLLLKLYEIFIQQNPVSL